MASTRRAGLDALAGREAEASDRRGVKSENEPTTEVEGEPGRTGDVRSSAATAQASPGPATSTRAAMDPFDMLAKGMAQLQSALAASMTSRSSEPEHVKPGISELPRLPELSETSCIDVGDWLHALQCPMGDLSNSSAAWWQEVLLCLDRFYQTYLKSSNHEAFTATRELCQCCSERRPLVSSGQEGNVNVVGEPAGVSEDRNSGVSFDGGASGFGKGDGVVSPRKHSGATADLEGLGAAGYCGDSC